MEDTEKNHLPKTLGGAICSVSWEGCSRGSHIFVDLGASTCGAIIVAIHRLVWQVVQLAINETQVILWEVLAALAALSFLGLRQIKLLYIHTMLKSTYDDTLSRTRF